MIPIDELVLQIQKIHADNEYASAVEEGSEDRIIGLSGGWDNFCKLKIQFSDYEEELKQEYFDRVGEVYGD